MEKQIKPTFSGRFVLIGIIFLIPISILFYATIFGNTGHGFLTSVVSGYLMVIIFLIIYIVLFRLAVYIFRKVKNNMQLGTIHLSS